MKIFLKKYLRPLMGVLVISLTSISFWACANVQHQATFNKNYLPKEDVCIKVAKVVNDTGYTFDIDIEQMLTNTLEQQLMEENLLNLGNTEPNLFMESTIIGYKKGSAFKRWMMPGWGATELSIRCDLKDEKNNIVGSAMSSREIVAGGLYTVGAWETIFKDVANDVAEDLKGQIEAHGYVVKSKTQSQIQTTGSENQKLASIPKSVTAFNPAEPWTGVWQVEGRINNNEWNMKQNGNIIKGSTQFYELSGKVSGSQLKGRLFRVAESYRFVIHISQDQQSFEGVIYLPNTIFINAKRRK